MSTYVQCGTKTFDMSRRDSNGVGFSVGAAVVAGQIEEFCAVSFNKMGQNSHLGQAVSARGKSAIMVNETWIFEARKIQSVQKMEKVKILGQNTQKRPYKK